ncbi:MAG TPA: MBL fold metallo-hydrolase, partial [Candidatus Nanoarchaeia archaeon]|nr:MBL fold metallo-hydrolase [Candidatus Nanoarchaeia archaeon]
MNNIEDIIQITEFGAAEAVPGSKLMLESGKNRILVDIGTEYKKDEENMPLPFDARSINQLLLTHGHADHMGQLLKLTKAGFKGKIFSTQETADITEKQLSQSVSSSF